VDGGLSSDFAASPQTERLSDAELVRLSLNGADEAFSRLLDRHGQHLRRLIARRLRDSEDVRDVLQDTHLAVWRGLQSYDARRPFEAWVTSIALNKCRDWARHRSVLFGLLARMQAEAAHTGPSIEERSAESIAIGRECMRNLARALDELPPPLREPLVLTTLEELPQAAVARELRLTRKAVEMRVRRARERLRVTSAAG
jgi:RNA polymerase sigma factor CnrH